jgi:hypothetical protein
MAAARRAQLSFQGQPRKLGKARAMRSSENASFRGFGIPRPRREGPSRAKSEARASREIKKERRLEVTYAIARGRREGARDYRNRVRCVFPSKGDRTRDLRGPNTLCALRTGEIKTGREGSGYF